MAASSTKDVHGEDESTLSTPPTAVVEYLHDEPQGISLFLSMDQLNEMDVDLDESAGELQYYVEDGELTIEK